MAPVSHRYPTLFGVCLAHVFAMQKHVITHTDGQKCLRVRGTAVAQNIRLRYSCPCVHARAGRTVVDINRGDTGAIDPSALTAVAAQNVPNDLPAELRHAHQLNLAHLLAVAALSPAGALARAAEGSATASTYVPGPVEVGWQIWVGFLAGVIPFAIGSWEFVKRLLIQQRCTECSGRGLVQRGKLLRKCPDCGGFFPWISWRLFLTSTASPGNGGPLQQPRGQTSVFYKVPPKPEETPQATAAAATSANDEAERNARL